jgi:peptidoglycan-N-acetylglucosamine deacetylase
VAPYARRVDRRALLKRLGIGGAGVAAIGLPVGTYAVGRHVGSERLSGDVQASVKAGQRTGAVNVWWSIDDAGKSLALTFDDGPTTQFTAEMLDVLDRYDAPATLFCIGELVDRHPDLVRRAMEAGHELGNHTFDHFSAATQSPDDVRRTVERGADSLAAITGDRPRWFRPVRGEITGALLAAATEFGHEVAMWSVSRDAVGDLADDDAAGVLASYTTDVGDGAVVIFHDGIGRSAFEWSGPDEQLMTQRRTEIDVLPQVIERYLADGFELPTLSELMARRPPA